jgi:energy-coupling factor transporter ATP-binding protein EcfA2
MVSGIALSHYPDRCLCGSGDDVYGGKKKERSGGKETGNEMTQREVVIILGKTGYGKSTWLQQYARMYPRIFVFDPFAAIPAQYLSEQQLIDAHEAGDFKQGGFIVGTRELANMDLIGAIAYLSGNCLFIIEECGVAFYKGERIPDWLAEIIFLGRHNAVSLCMTAQRAASIPIELRSQANRFITFRQTERKDVEWTRDYVGDLFEQIPTLPKFKCIDADNDSVTVYSVSAPGTPSPACETPAKV